jgi:hypothetical protein
MMVGKVIVHATKTKHVTKYPNQTILNVTATGQQRKNYLNITTKPVFVNPQHATGLNVLMGD